MDVVLWNGMSSIFLLELPFLFLIFQMDCLGLCAFLDDTAYVRFDLFSLGNARNMLRLRRQT